MIVTNSEDGVFHTCIRKWYYQYVLMKTTEGFVFYFYEGSAFHYAAEILFTDCNVKQMLDRVDDYMNENSTPLDPVEEAIMNIRIKFTVVCTFEYWKDRRKEYELVQPEKVLVVPFETTEDKMAGGIDVVVKHKATGKYFIVEYKTTSEAVDKHSSNFWIRLNFDNQIRQYHYMIKVELNYICPSIYIVVKKHSDNKLKNIINPKTGAPLKIQRRKDETDEALDLRKAEAVETLQNFEDRLMKEARENYNKYSFTKNITITDQEIRNWTANMHMTLNTMKRCQELETYPQNDDACENKFRQLCSFFNVCAGIQSIDAPCFQDKEFKHPEIKI